MERDVCLLVNPAAGGGRAGRAAAPVCERLRSLGCRTRLERTRDVAHARELALAAAAASETVAVLSGDGLLGAVADVLREVEGAVIGVLPGGRGNDFARTLGIAADPLAACETIAFGQVIALDLGEVAGRAFVGIASVGFDSEANRIANEAPSALGGLVYAYGALRALSAWHPVRFDVRLEPDSRRESAFSFTGYTVACASSKAYGGGMMLAPAASLQDGLLDVVTIAEVAKLRFLANLPKVFKGSHVRLPSVQVHRAAEVEISAQRRFDAYADGDPIGELPVRVRALPGAIGVLVPAGAGAL